MLCLLPLEFGSNGNSFTFHKTKKREMTKVGLTLRSFHYCCRRDENATVLLCMDKKKSDDL